MAITVSGPTIIFDDTSVAQASLYNETFGTGVFPEGGTSLTIQGGTAFSSATGGNGNVATIVGVRTDASLIFDTPQSGSITVNPIVSGVYVFAVGGGAGGQGVNALFTRTAGGNGTPSFFSTVVGGGGTSSGTATGGAAGIAAGGTTNTPGSAGSSRPGTGDGGNAGGFPNGIAGAGGAGFPGGITAGAGTTGELYGGGGGGAASVSILLVPIGGAGGGGGGLAIHSRLTVTGGSPYSYQVGVGGFGGTPTPGPTGGVAGGAGRDGYLAFTLFD